MTQQWVEAMWNELDSMPLEQQVVASGEWITMMTQELLPQLGKHRRARIVEILKLDDWDAIRLAETIGSRPSTITRLAEEGRAQERADKTVAATPTPPLR